MLAVGAVMRPALSLETVRAVRRDRLVLPGPGDESTPFERRAAERFRDELGKILGPAEK